MGTPALGITDGELYARHVLALNTRLLCPIHGFVEPVVGHVPEGFVLKCGRVRPSAPVIAAKYKSKGGGLGSYGPELKLLA
jgi:hypothetical protein